MIVPFSNTPLYPLGDCTERIVFLSNLSFRKSTTVWTSGSSGTSLQMLINKFHIDILLDSMSPINVINNIDDSKGSMIDDMPLGNRLIMFNQLSLSLTYPLN